MHTQQDSDAALQNNLTISEKSVVPYTHSSGYAIASLILGIISSALACIPILSTICSILGIIFVIKVRKQEKVFHNGLVTAGLILCICGFVLSLLFMAVLFLHLQQNWGTLMEMVRLQYKMRAGFWKPMQKSLPVSPRRFQVT